MISHRCSLVDHVKLAKFMRPKLALRITFNLRRIWRSEYTQWSGAACRPSRMRGRSRTTSCVTARQGQRSQHRQETTTHHSEIGKRPPHNITRHGHFPRFHNALGNMITLRPILLDAPRFHLNFAFIHIKPANTGKQS